MADKFDAVPLAGSVLPPVSGIVPLGADLADEDIEVLIWLRRKSADALPDFEAEGFKPIDRKALVETWGGSEADVEAVMEYLKYVDARIERVDEDRRDKLGSVPRRLLGLRGPADALKRAFGANTQAARLPSGESILVRTGPLTIPTALEKIVQGVFGLDTRPIGTRGRATTVADPVSAAGEALPTPPQIADRYEFPAFTKAKCRGQVIALMQFGGGYDPAHPQAYFNDLRVSQPTLIDVGVAGGANRPGSPYDKEVTLDIEVAGSVAEEATLVTYFAPHTEAGWIAGIDWAVYDTTYEPYIMSISWGAPELGTSNSLSWTPAGMAAMRDLFADAARIGMTVLAACGDDGADCRVGDWNAHVPYPGSDPRVIACGGTTIAKFVSNPAGEIAWRFGGGGISDFFSQVPTYQRAVSLPISRNTLTVARGVPDVAGYADPGYEFWVGEKMTLAGTSLVAPLYAAAFARLNAKVHSPAGYYHPTLYAASTLTRDIDDPASNGTSNGLNGAPGYYGRPGWDARTGLGVFKPGR